MIPNGAGFVGEVSNFNQTDTANCETLSRYDCVASVIERYSEFDASKSHALLSLPTAEATVLLSVRSLLFVVLES